MERLAYLTPGDRIEAEDLAFILLPRGQSAAIDDLGRSLSDATSRFQTDYIRRTIEQLGGNMSQVAEQFGLHRSNLYRKMNQLGHGRAGRVQGSRSLLPRGTFVLPAARNA